MCSYLFFLFYQVPLLFTARDTSSIIPGLDGVLYPKGCLFVLFSWPRISDIHVDQKANMQWFQMLCGM